MTASEWLRRQLDTTPAKLRAMQMGTVVLAALIGVLGVIGLSRRSADLRQAAVSADSLVRIQGVRAALVRADALASESYLLGGKERPEQRQQFVDRLAEASAGLVAVSRQLSVTEAALLADVGSGIATYSGLIEQARSNNRQGFPVGAAYQRQANAMLSADLLASLGEAEQAVRDLVNRRLDNAADDNVWISLPVLLFVAAVVAASVWLTRHFNRSVNVPLALAGLVAVIAMFTLLNRSSAAFDASESAVGGPLQRADLTAQLRSALLDARSQESLTLINRGNGAANEASWAGSMADVEAARDELCQQDACPVYGDSLTQYRSAHAAMREVDDGGDWDAAVEQVVGLPSPSTLTRAFDDVVEQSRVALDQDATTARAALDDARSPLGVLRIAVVVAALAIAGLAVAGYNRRLAEYR